MYSEKGFTLIELLIVIGILAVLAVTAVLVLNPAEYFKKSRDATRLSDLSTVHRAVALYQTDGGTSFGTSDTVYVSIPDTSTTCANLGLPSLPDGWSYACSNTANYRKADSNGWIPVSFTSLSYGAVLNILPIDPINTASTGNFYTYVTGSSWELTSLFESDKYSSIAINDGDAYPGIYSIRTSQTSLTPGIRDKGLVGYWKFDEASGTLYDSSGYGNNGTQSGGVTYGVTGQVDNALSFDGEDDYVNFGNPETLKTKNKDFSVSLWGNTFLSSGIFIYKGVGTARQGWGIGRYNTALRFQYSETIDGYDQTLGVSFPINEWAHIVMTIDKNLNILTAYIDGSFIGTLNIAGISDFSDTKNLYFGYGGTEYFRFNGLIDDVRIYNRALSASEIFAIYDATK